MNSFDAVMQFFMSIGRQMLDIIPGLLGAVGLLFVGWMAGKIAYSAVIRILHRLGVKKLNEKLKEIDIFSNLNIDLAMVLGRIVYWAIILIFMTAASESAGLTTISQGIGRLIAYLPQLLSAAAFFMAGMFFANGVKSIIEAAVVSMGIPTGRIIAAFIFYFLVIMISITALNQAGMDTQIITQNVTIGAAAIFFAFTLAYGFASRDILANLLASFYSRDKFTIGQRIVIDDVEGVIVNLDSTSVTLDTETGRQIILPLQKLLNSKVEIIKET